MVGDLQVGRLWVGGWGAAADAEMRRVSFGQLDLDWVWRRRAANGEGKLSGWVSVVVGLGIG